MNKDRINTGELAALLASHLKVGVRETEDFLTALIEVMEEQLLANDVLKIKGLGTFKLQWNEPRKSVDVNTSAEILIDGYYKISFAPEPELKELVNAPYAYLQPVVLGGPEPEEMDEEEEVEVEEEIMKEMEDPQKLADAMRTITEQAIEIKDILSEMNLMGGVQKRTPRPQMVNESPSKPVTPPVRTVAERATVSPVEDAQAEPVIEQPVVQKPRRPGPVVPYGPPPEPTKRQAQLTDGDMDYPPRPAARRSQEEMDYPPRPAARRSQEEMDYPPRPAARRSQEEDEFPPRPAARRSQESEEYPGRPVSRLPRKSYFPEQDESQPEVQPLRTSKPPRKGHGVIMLFAGLVIGVAATYVLNIAGILPVLQWSGATEAPAEPAMIDLPRDADSYQEDPVLTDTLRNDSITTTKAQPVQTVDSLQILFDTPRTFSDFIASEEVRDGSRMTRISERHYGAKEFWVYIYEANRNLLNHPDDIAKGMVLKIPRVDPRLIDKNNPRCIEYAIELHDKYLKK